MLDDVLVTRATGFGGLIPGILLIGLFGAAIVTRLRGRSVGRAWQRLLAASVGGHFGFALIVTGDAPIVRGALLLGALAIGLWLVWVGRRTDAGWFALAVAGPWTLLWGYFVALLVAGANFEPYSTVATFLFGVVPSAIALIVGLAGDPLPPEPRADAPVGQPGSRRLGNLANALRSEMSVGPMTTMELAGFAVLLMLLVIASAVSLPVPPLVTAVGLVVIGTVLATEVALRAMPARARRALEAMAWVAEWEFERARQIGLGTIPTTPRAADRWIERNPEQPGDRWIRSAVLVLAGRIDTAAEVVDRMQERTPYQRFEKVLAGDLVDWAGGGAGHLDAVRAAAGEVGPLSDDARLRAEVEIATQLGRQRLAEGGDGIGPLVEVRELLGTRPDARIGPVFRQRLRLAMLLGAIVLVGAAYLTDPVADAIVDVLR